MQVSNWPERHRLRHNGVKKGKGKKKKKKETSVSSVRVIKV